LWIKHIEKFELHILKLQHTKTFGITLASTFF